MEIRIIPLDKIIEDEEQPRREMDPESLQGLAESIRQHGLLQPITVRHLSNVNMYKIITGERRWRACRIADFEEIPCIVKASDEDTVTEQLIENLQREDLQPLDRAKALQTLKFNLMLNNKDLADRLGLSERAVGNLLAIMNLPVEISEKIVSTGGKPSDGRLTEKHARHIKQLNDNPSLQARVVDKIEREQLTGDEAGVLIGKIRREPKSVESFLDKPFDRAAVEMGGKPSGPAGKVVEFARYLQGLDLKRLSGKQQTEMSKTLDELKRTAQTLMEELVQIQKIN